MKKTDIAASQPSYEEILRKERRANSAWNKLRRNKTAMIGLFIIVIMTAIAVFAPFITGGKPNEIHPIDAYLGFFEKGHLFGTDEAGRDLFTRICYGARVSLLVAVGATVLGGVIGVDLYRVTPAAWWMRSLCAAWTASWHFLLSCCPLSL